MTWIVSVLIGLIVVFAVLFILLARLCAANYNEYQKRITVLSARYKESVAGITDEYIEVIRNLQSEINTLKQKPKLALNHKITSLIVIATESPCDNEARNAALAACKRLKKIL